MSSNRRLNFYVDGFNLYFGLREAGWRRFYWLNIHNLAASLAGPNQCLESVKYFTSHVKGEQDKKDRQITYLEALGTLDGLFIYYGKYQRTPKKCAHCGKKNRVHSEKMTDVNIATELLCDAFQDSFDDAVVVSADSDLSAPIKAVKRLFPEKRIVIAFPPKRTSKELIRIADAYLTIGRRKISAGQFPGSVKRADGFELVKPEEWK